jgi:3',5'-cyclic AMP phosphodiesterase CpdA
VHHLFGGNGLTPADRAEDNLFRRLHCDLEHLAGEHGLRPDLLVATGDLAEWGLRSEFQQVSEFLGTLSEAAGIPRRHVAIVPGNHDINRKACAAYFAEQESDEAEPVAPYWPKWRHYAAAFDDYYAGPAAFTPDEPWTLFEMPELGVVVAGLNSTMAEPPRRRPLRLDRGTPAGLVREAAGRIPGPGLAPDRGRAPQRRARRGPGRREPP